VLDDQEAVDAVRARVRGAGIETGDSGVGGFIVRDPWNIAVVFAVGTPTAE